MPFIGGQKLGPYEIVATLGAGGMGVVYRARDTRLGRDVAIKVLPDGFADDAGRLGRFELEARAVAALNHPNVLAVYDVGRHEGAPYLVMELLEGQSLRERLLAGPITPRKALEYAVQIAQGLAAAHDKGLVHRDLKPENLFLTIDERLKILDFGLARSLGDVGSGAEGGTLAQSQSGAVLGTAGYMSPEQVRGQPADARSDIFALGVVLYECLTGARAFAGATAVERGYATLNAEPPPLAKHVTAISPAVERVVSRCLEKAPEQRFQSARDVAYALEAVSGVASSADAFAPVAGAPARRRSWSPLALGALALLLGAALGWSLSGRAPTPLAAATPPHFTRITFSPDTSRGARFTPDGRVVYGRFSATRVRVVAATPGKPDELPLTEAGFDLLAVSSQGELAVGSDGRVARMSLAGGAPRPLVEAAWVDWAPDGGALAVVRSEAGKSRIEYPPGHVVFESTSSLSYIRFNGAGDRIAFLRTETEGQDALQSIEVVALAGAPDAGTHQVVSGPWPNVTGMAWAPGGKEIWVTGRAEGRSGRDLWAIGLDGSKRLVLETPGWLMLQDIAPDGRVLLKVADVGYRLRALLPDAGRERDLSWFDQSLVADVSADGQRVLFSEEGSAFDEVPQVFTRSTSGSLAVHLGQGVPYSLSHDGKWALVSPRLPPRTLQLVPLGAGNPRDLPGEYAGIAWASFVGDGDQVSVWAHLEGQPAGLWLQSVDGGLPRPALENVDQAGRPSPDGRHLVVWQTGPPFLWDVQTGERQPLPSLRGKLAGWTADGGAMLVMRPGDEGARDALWQVSLADGGSTRLHDLEFGQVWLIAASGGTVAYTHRLERSVLYVVDGLK